MMRRVFLFAAIGFLALSASFRAWAEIVVLTDKPVAEFTLPDGSVLKNAYAWKRTSEGIMIIHDDGQYFLNFKTLPDDWREAYGVLDSIGQVQSAASARYDQFSIFPIIDHLEGLSHTAVTYYKSERYKQENDAALLSACIYQGLLDGRQPKAARLAKILGQLYPDYEQIDVSTFYDTCPSCEGKCVFTGNCATCGGTGKCPTCNGTGEIESQFVHQDATSCTACKGTGKCPKCGGAGKLTYKCNDCKGLGKILKKDAVRAKLAIQVQRLNKYEQNVGK